MKINPAVERGVCTSRLTDATFSPVSPSHCGFWWAQPGEVWGVFCHLAVFWGPSIMWAHPCPWLTLQPVGFWFFSGAKLSGPTEIYFVAHKWKWSSSPQELTTLQHVDFYRSCSLFHNVILLLCVGTSDLPIVHSTVQSKAHWAFYSIWMGDISIAWML